MRHLISSLLAVVLGFGLATTALAQDGGSGDDGARPPQEQPAETKSDDGRDPAPPAPAADSEPDRSDPVQRDLSAYRLRVGDTLDVIVYQHEELTRQGIGVPGNGQIAFPPIGKIELLDKTVFEVAAEIRQKLQDEDFLTDPKVDCIVTGYAPRFVYLVGAVRGVVNLPVHKNVRLLEVLAMSGSLSNPSADFSRVTVRRAAAAGSYNIDISVSAILERNDEEKNIVLFEGDYIVIRQLEEASPLSSDFVYILGKVRQPGRHPVIKGRTTFTLTKLIALAGDFDEFADTSEVTIIRKSETGRQRMVVDFDEIIEGQRPDVELMADDLVYVPERFF